MAYRPGPLKIIGNVIRSILYGLIAAMVLLLVWRIWFSTKIPEKIKQLNINEQLSAAYADGQLYGFDQPQEEFTRADENYGYFSIEDYVIIPEAKQVQIIFRYNNSTVEALAEDYDLPEVPDRTKQLYQVSLVKTTDLTPDDREDNDNALCRRETRYMASEIITEHTLLYTFHRIVFDGVELGEDDIALFADIHYVEDIDYEKLPYGTICLYDDETRDREYEFDKKDLKRLEKSVK